MRTREVQTQTLHALGFPAGDHIRTADMVTHAQQQQCQTTHSRARHPYKVDLHGVLPVG